MTIEELVREGSQTLRNAGITSADTDARRLLQGLVAHSFAIVRRDDAIDIADQYRARIEDRAQHRPVSHILGTRAFWKHDFSVTSDVLDPRPETELLVALALDGLQPERVLDLGTGSGAILLSLLAEWGAKTHGMGTDISTAALNVARRNAEQLGIVGVDFIQSDWFDRVVGLFDLIVSNPPYIAESEMKDLSRTVRDWEPHLALTPGGDGLEPYRQIAANIRQHATPNARILLEIGPTQADPVSRYFAQMGSVSVHKDLDGRDRVVEIRM
ncbi:peptide chain release factor N(5)-glutamine methyltransferase [Pontivivens insulae]|uniref:Release factor glutamine methyltransferase n=1 Tax=Pontivivens insulae TaxID=1639689 RepID=A0A2R8ABD9_9RHOB|nr:peptide chain release factor N(5)-glutamine methyltransferase [Pontivivens insulae]RED13306.1 [protein release factor]-glutamine N5-methyltransferase [Pontivivens insulae]SPF29398.1 Release factor glutamine methyltransferase [Pontivivens insulae]